MTAPAAWSDVRPLPVPAAERPVRWPGIAARLVILGALGGIAAHGEDVRRALAFRLLAVILTVLALASRRVARMLDLPFAWAWWILRKVTLLLTAAVVDLAFALPARAASRLLGREPIAWRRLDASSRWIPREPVHSSPRWSDGGAALSGAVPLGGGTSRFARAAVMVVVVAIALDVMAGAAWNGQSSAAGTEFSLPAAQPPSPPGTVPPYPDTRYESPAYADSPWAEDYFREFRSQDYEGVPYVQSRYRDRSGRYVNVKDNVRRSWSEGAGPVVWFFGGSTVFGEGQRDDHTIPSEVARLAAADGHPIQAVNFGVQADSNFQSVLRFEDALASDRPAPDLVVFYDGANEVSQHQSQPATDQPQYYQGPGGPSSPDEGGGLFEAWRRASLIGQLWGRTSGTEDAALPAPPSVLAEQTAGVYARGIELAATLAEADGVPFASFFQPAQLYDDSPWVQDLRRNLPDGTIDISGALDGPGQATYIDAVHTNEQGSQIVARAIYDELAEQIAALPG